MNTWQQMIKKSFYTFLYILLMLSVSNGQSTKQPAKQPEKSAPAKQSDKSIIDSLHTIIETQYIRIDTLDSLLEAEKQTAEELREQVIRIDDYRKKLEANINSFKGENLKLNQSNRILIVFNSLVAVLLIISLIFFIRKIGRRRIPANGAANNVPGKSGDKMKFTSFDDKLQQLERLGKLREKALLSEEEFLAEKQRILGKQ